MVYYLSPILFHFLSFSFRQSRFVWIVAVGAIFHIGLVNAILYQNLEVLPSASPLPIWASVNGPSVLAAYDDSLLPSNDIAKLNSYGTDYYHPQILQTTFGTIKSPSDVLDDSLYGYYHNGRLLKQYFVAEENVDDINALNSFLSRFMPFVPTPNYNVPASKLPNLGFPTSTPQPALSTFPTNSLANQYPLSNLFSIQPRISTVPVQLGSGSLGYVRLPNGAVFLGSGSLGYTNDQLKAEQLHQVRNRDRPAASPVTFGETPR